MLDEKLGLILEEWRTKCVAGSHILHHYGWVSLASSGTTSKIRTLHDYELLANRQ